MPFAWPNFAQILYRLWRLRRAVILCVGLLFLLTLVLSLSVELVALSQLFLWGMFAFLTALVLLHLVILPNAFGEVVNVTLFGLLTLLLCAYFHDPLLQSFVKNPVTTSITVVVLGAMAGPIAFIFFNMFLIGSYSLGPRRSFRLTGRLVVPCDMPTAHAHFCPRPNMIVGHSQNGPLADDGFFDWSTKNNFPVGDAAVMQGRTQIIADETALYQAMSVDSLDVENCVTTSVITFAAADQGCCVTYAEFRETAPFLHGFNLWLMDWMTDYVQFLEDMRVGRASLTNNATHLWSINLAVTAYVLNPSNADDNII